MRPTFSFDFATTRWLLAAVAGLPLLAAGWGCSGSSSLPTIPVHGQVTYNGQPVTQGTVTFLPRETTDGAPRRPATGAIQPDGTYRLATLRPDDGAMPGEYQVVIVSITSGPSPEAPAAPEVWAIPKHYGNPLQTDLQATIPADGKGPLKFDFTLQDSTTAPRALPSGSSFQET
jgi:hypothetical protein